LWSSALVLVVSVFTDRAPTASYTLSLHDALPISARRILPQQTPGLQRRRPMERPRSAASIEPFDRTLEPGAMKGQSPQAEARGPVFRIPVPIVLKFEWRRLPRWPPALPVAHLVRSQNGYRLFGQGEVDDLTGIHLAHQRAVGLVELVLAHQALHVDPAVGMEARRLHPE